MEKYKVVILAAGQGKRMKLGKNKQFLLISEIPLLIHTLGIFEEDSLCKSIILVANRDEIKIVEQLIEEYNIKKIEKLVPGGKERQQSVYEGIKAIEGDPIVLIHDGARPFIYKSTIHKLVSTVMKKGSAIVATPVKETIKQVEEAKVKRTIAREHLWAAQTPQAFRHSEILAGHELAEESTFEATDDASIMENAGKNVYIVEGDYENIKITTQEDLVFAQAIFNNRREEI